MTFWQRWRFSLLALGASIALGAYTLWNNPMDPPVAPQPGTGETTPQEPLTVYQWQTLTQLRLVRPGLTARYRADAPVSERWEVQNQPRPLSDMEQVLLDNTLAQLRTLNVRRLLLENPTPQQLSAFGLDQINGATELWLTGDAQEHLIIGAMTPTRSGYYFYLPRLQKVYLGYVNIPEALVRLTTPAS